MHDPFFHPDSCLLPGSYEEPDFIEVVEALEEWLELNPNSTIRRQAILKMLNRIAIELGAE